MLGVITDDDDTSDEAIRFCVLGIITDDDDTSDEAIRFCRIAAMAGFRDTIFLAEHSFVLHSPSPSAGTVTGYVPPDVTCHHSRWALAVLRVWDELVVCGKSMKKGNSDIDRTTSL